MRTFQQLKNLKNKFCCKPLRICVKLVTIIWLSPLLSKKLHGNTLRHAWDRVILHKTAYFKHFEQFPAIEKFKKTNFAANHCEYVWNWSQQPDFHHCWATNCMIIPWGIPEKQWFCFKQLKTAYFKHFEYFPSIEKFKKQLLQQTTVIMCETGHNNLPFTTVEQKIVWEYLEAYLRYSDFT